ncbi:MAG: cytochrome c biogenesis protein CcsA [Gemmatimonadota bacterium]
MMTGAQASAGSGPTAGSGPAIRGVRAGTGGLALGLATLVTMLAGSAAGLFLVPADTTQGEIQRLMYVHVPGAWLAMLSFFMVFVMSILYLVQRRPAWDLMAASSAEIGVLFTVLTLALGSLWAKPTWGVWWTWDPRLTTTAILLMVYVGYLSVRGFAEDPEKRARWSAVVGIVGFVDVPIVYLSVYWWRSIHQPPSSPRSVAPVFVAVLLLNLFAFTLCYVYLMIRRFRLAVAEQQLERVEAEGLRTVPDPDRRGR